MYKDIIIDCLNNDKVIPPRIRLNIYNKILKRIIIGDEIMKQNIFVLN